MRLQAKFSKTTYRFGFSVDGPVSNEGVGSRFGVFVFQNVVNGPNKRTTDPTVVRSEVRVLRHNLLSVRIADIPATCTPARVNLHSQNARVQCARKQERAMLSNQLCVVYARTRAHAHIFRTAPQIRPSDSSSSEFLSCFARGRFVHKHDDDDDNDNNNNNVTRRGCPWPAVGAVIPWRESTGSRYLYISCY